MPTTSCCACRDTILLAFVLAGICAAASASCSGCKPSHQGFYLAVATLACQFFVLWACRSTAGSPTTALRASSTAQQIVILGYAFDTPARKYF